MTVLRPAVPNDGSPSMLPTTATTSQTMIPAVNQRSNIELLRDALPNVSMPKPLNRAEFPNCKFWEKTSWEQWTKEGKERGVFVLGKRGKGVNSSWMEDTNGNRVEYSRQQEILEQARKSWETMKDFNVRIGPWTRLPVQSTDFFCARMASMFIELQLCENHWKIRELWAENYTSFSSSRDEDKVAQKKRKLLGVLTSTGFTSMC